MEICVRNLAIAFSLFVVSGCASYEPTFTSPVGPEPTVLYILPIVQQEEIAVRAGTSNTAAATGMQYGVVGAVVGSMIDSAMNEHAVRKAERKAEVLRESAAGLDLREHIGEATALASGHGWVVKAVGDVTSNMAIEDQVVEILKDREIDAVMVLSATYLLTSQVDQLIVSIDQQVYPRFIPDKARLTSRKNISYQSPVHPITYRPFAEGEKDQLKRAIEWEYEQEIVMQPTKETELRRSLRAELRELDDATQIPDYKAIAEAWPPHLLSGYLDQAKRHLRHMLEIDWSEREKADMSIANLGELYAVLPDWRRIKQRGVLMDTLGGNEIYRMKSGDLYSVPPAPELSSAAGAR